MATTGSTGLLTLDEFFNLPEKNGWKQELIEGELVELPPPKRIHYDVARRISLALVFFFRDSGGNALRVGLEFASQYTRSFLIPDVAVERERQPRNQHYYKDAPLIAIEVVSDSNRGRAIDRKRKLYLAHGGQEVWVVYPSMRCVDVFRAGEVNAVRHEHKLESPALPGFVLDLDWVFEE